MLLDKSLQINISSSDWSVNSGSWKFHTQKQFSVFNEITFYFSTRLGCPKMTQHWKCLGIRADSGAKILVILEIGHRIEID